MELLLIYILGFLVTFNLYTLWYYSLLRVTIGRWFWEDIDTKEDFDTKILVRAPHFIAGALTCKPCTAFWLSLLVGIGLCCYFYLDIFTYPILTALTWPALIYRLDKHS